MSPLLEQELECYGQHIVVISSKHNNELILTITQGPFDCWDEAKNFIEEEYGQLDITDIQFDIVSLCSPNQREAVLNKLNEISLPKQ